jgi:hypothetical protein
MTAGHGVSVSITVAAVRAMSASGPALIVPSVSLTWTLVCRLARA